jgi:pre-mRNA-splicing factor RBM22/SLT11
MLDLSFGLPITIRDQALKMIAPGPESEVNREYFAQNNEREIEEGRGGIEAYEKTDEKARELLRRLANSEPYHKRQRRLEIENGEGQKMLPAPVGSEAKHIPGPIRTRDTRKMVPQRGGRGGRGGFVGGRGAQQPPQPEDILPPKDPNITSLFVTGVDDDLPEHEIRTFFAKYGQLRSVVCSHRAHCAFINYMTRQGAEDAAQACQGRAVLKGCPLRVQWGKPKPLDSMEHDARLANARAGRQTDRAVKAATGAVRNAYGQAEQAAPENLDDLAALAPAPGAEDDEANYASLAGN